MTKAKIRQRLEDGSLLLGDNSLDVSGLGLSGIGIDDRHDGLSEHPDDNLSGYDLLDPGEGD